MQKVMSLTIALTLSAAAFGGANTTTETMTTEERYSAQAMNTEIGQDSEMLEAEEYDQSLDADEVNEERMEERVKDDSFIKSEDEIDYRDRTRTNRERKAINTGSDASDDQ